jgi:hypothetical protein
MRELLAQIERRDADKREGIRQAVASSEPPLSADLVESIIHLNANHVRAIMCHHKGFQFAERRDSYLSSLATMECCIHDLLSAISAFEKEAKAEESELFHRSGDDTISRTQRQIQKELFATANAAASLVDHARLIKQFYDSPDYDAKRVEFFGTDGTHEFVIDLRVMLHHLHVVGANYLITKNYETGQTTATFTVSKETVLRVIADHFKGKVKAPMRAFVHASPELIDLHALFIDYGTRISNFHAWMKTELASEALISLRDYDRIVREKKNFDTRLFWKGMMGNWLNWSEPPDPHSHLNRYLTTAQLEEVYKLPRNSKAQVDLVIAYVDNDNAVDDELRQMAYTFFERAE